MYVKQPPSFKNETFPHHVFKMSKALYGLKQTQELGIKDLALFFFKNGFKRGKANTILFIMHQKDDFLIVQIYVDDIIFCATNQNLCKNFSKLMEGECNTPKLYIIYKF